MALDYDQDEVDSAHHVTISTCRCGCKTVYFELRDEDDAVFAIAPFPQEIARLVAANIAKAAGAN